MYVCGRCPTYVRQYVRDVVGVGRCMRKKKKNQVNGQQCKSGNLIRYTLYRKEKRKEKSGNERVKGFTMEKRGERRTGQPILSAAARIPAVVDFDLRAGNNASLPAPSTAANSTREDRLAPVICARCSRPAAPMPLNLNPTNPAVGVFGNNDGRSSLRSL